VAIGVRDLDVDLQRLAAPLPVWRGSVGPDAWRAAARAGYEAWQETPGVLDDIVRGMRDLLPEDAIVTNGAGNFTRPVQRAYSYRRPGRQLAPISGAMGYGLPAAMAAALAHPERAVVCVAGDGDLLMTGQELATIAHHGLRVTVLVVDNGAYGTIRTHQERRYPGPPRSPTPTSCNWHGAMGCPQSGPRASTTRWRRCAVPSARAPPLWCTSSASDGRLPAQYCVEVLLRRAEPTAGRHHPHMGGSEPGERLHLAHPAIR